VTLHIFDICNDSEFPSAPVVDPATVEIWTNQNDLVDLTLTWAEDDISATTENVCADYSIETELDSDASDFEGGPIDTDLAGFTITAGNAYGMQAFAN